MTQQEVVGGLGQEGPGLRVELDLDPAVGQAS